MHKIIIGLAAASCLALSTGASFAQDRPDQRQADQRQADHRVVEQDHMDRGHHGRHRVCTVHHHHRVCSWR